MRHVLIAIVAMTAMAQPAAAADLPLPAPAGAGVTTSSGWSFTIAPYAWIAGIEGDVAVANLPATHVNASFIDIVENLDAPPVMFVAEARFGHFGLFGDLIYTKIADTAATPRGLLANSATLTSTTFTAMAGAEYRVFEGTWGSVDLIGGARVWALENQIDFSGGPLALISPNLSKSWIDPMIGAKARIDLTPQIYLTMWGMVGGFGVSSRFTWDALAGVGYAFNDSISAVVGYRALAVDYESGGFLFDVVQHGPILGAVFKF